jgi:hypothetical protein
MLCIAPVTETRKPGLRGEREGNRKTIAQGMPVDFGGPVVTNSRVFYYTRGCGCVVHPAFPAPSSLGGRDWSSNPGAIRAAGRLSLVIARSVSDEAIQLTFWIASLALAMT